jgi:hypothetical protein
MTQFEFARANPVLAALFWLFAAPPVVQHIQVRADVVRVRLGWIFTATIAREAITSAGRDQGRVGGIGAHGWAGRWLVNTSTKGMVRIETDPEAAVRGHVLGVPVKVLRLRLSLADPDGFVAALES